MKTITTTSQLHIALAKVFENVDFDQIGQVKDHMKLSNPDDANSDKVPTGEVFLTAQVRMPQGSALHIGGTDFYPNTLQVKIDGFKLSAQPGERAASTAKAATSNADALRQRLNIKPGDVVAVKAPVKDAAETPVS